eukprot:TRINITY_DN2332_c0_g1_i2.p1 TRINITY_DN2332_c0_g1~~TRINITY_DN2332_c0_g1_i2.p1  ORF type:complete len:240 (-),score=70.62 TRINITY_DN2332_c0_g1_i2:8-727(-)
MFPVRSVTYGILLDQSIPVDQFTMNLFMILPVALTYNAYSTLVFYFVLLTKDARAQFKASKAGMPHNFRNGLIVFNILALILPAVFDTVRYYTGISMALYSNTFTGIALFFGFAGFLRYGLKFVNMLKESKKLNEGRRSEVRVSRQLRKVVIITSISSVLFVITIILLLAFTFVPTKDHVDMVLARHSAFRVIEWILMALILLTFQPQSSDSSNSSGSNHSGSTLIMNKFGRSGRGNRA